MSAPLGAVSFHASWADYDNDGDLDLHIGNEGEGNPNRLYQNGGDGAFTDVAETAGVDLFGISGIAGTNMGWADYDNDGDLDLAMTRAALEFAPADVADVKAFLFRNNGNGAFTEVIGAAGVDDLEKAGEYDGAVWADYDNDGDLDLFRNNGDRPSRLFRNEGNGTFTDVAETAGVEGSNQGTVAWADYDNDGDLDLFASPVNVPDHLYRNDGPRQRWLHVELVGSASNRSGVGAVATVVTGNRRQRRDVVARAAGGSSLPLEFGSGNAAKVDSLIIVWPSGRVDVLTDLAVDRFIRVVEGAATAVLEDHASTRPQTFALWQNYPNPFNGGTVFRFALPARQPVELAVYNLMGQKVARLVNGMRPAGVYTVHWDGTDDQDRDLASGLYLFRLQAGVRTATKKLLLLR